MRKNGISGIPVTRGRKLVGILTSRDVRFETNLDKKVEEVMTRKLITAREGVSKAAAHGAAALATASRSCWWSTSTASSAG